MSPFEDSLVNGLTRKWVDDLRIATAQKVEAEKNAMEKAATKASATAKRTTAASGGYALQQLEEDPSSTSVSSGGNTPLKGSVASLKVIRGRSQIIKFAQPLRRLSIAEPTLAEVIPLSPDQVMINGKQRGVTSLIVWDENGQEGIFDLYVQNDTSELLQAVNAIAPNEKIDARITDDSFILSGQVSNTVILDEIRKLASAYGYRDANFVDLTETPVPQVNLKVRIAEASRDVLRNLKTSMNYNGGTLNFTRLGSAVDFNYLNRTPLPTNGLNPIPRFLGNLPAGVRNNPLTSLQTASNVGGMTGSFLPGSTKNLQTAWDLLETSGKLVTLAEPTLLVTHGRTADFLAGGEFPYVSGTDQNGSPILSFREYGVKLKFTPWIAIRSGRIEMKVEPEVSSLDSANCVPGAGGAQVCGLLKRSTSTTVELKDGETLIISGIISRSEQNNFQKIPFIGDLPILGAFFKNAALQHNERELVVVITPHILGSNDYGKIMGGAG